MGIKNERTKIQGKHSQNLFLLRLRILLFMDAHLGDLFAEAAWP